MNFNYSSTENGYLLMSVASFLWVLLELFMKIL